MLARLANGRIKGKRADLTEVLRGRVTKHHRFMMRLHLAEIDAIDAAIGAIDTEIEANLVPFRCAADMLTSIPGVGQLGACVIVAEIGTDMGRFLSAAHLERRPKPSQIKRLVAKLTNLGYAVEIKPLAA